MLYLDGPLTYMLGQEFSHDDLQTSVRHICGLLEIGRIHTLILDHHLLRDQCWKEKMGTVFSTAENLGKKVTTFAGFLGQQANLSKHRDGSSLRSTPTSPMSLS